MVEYSMGISILKPVDMSKGNRTLLYETVNRGRKNLPFLNIGGDAAKAGDGFLQREGYTLAWSGWEGDITTGLKIALPIAVNPDGSPITGRVRAEYILDRREHDGQRHRARPPMRPRASTMRAPS